MKEEDQLIAIAEACGWMLVDDKLSGRAPRVSDIHYEKHGNDPIPDYLHDLNAMHEALLAQPQEVRDKINGVLMEMNRPNDSHVLDRTINATAAQRAEAFLRTIGKWKEDA